MTDSRHHAAPLRTARGRSTTSRVLSAGLATATCIGVVGMLGARQIEDSAATQQDVAAQAADATLAVSSTGLTQAQLDAYAAQLQTESAKLDAYRAKLVKVASQLTSTAEKRGNASVPATVVKKPQPVAKPAPKPAPKPVAKPAPQAKKPQSNTKSS
jgi:hypothetical protein